MKPVFKKFFRFLSLPFVLDAFLVSAAVLYIPSFYPSAVLVLSEVSGLDMSGVSSSFVFCFCLLLLWSVFYVCDYWGAFLFDLCSFLRRLILKRE